MGHVLAQGTVVEPAATGAVMDWRESVARLLNRAIFFSLMALIALTAIPYGTVTPGWEAIFECAVFALGLLWVVEGLLGKSWRVSGLPLLAPLLGLVVLAFFQTIPLRGTGPISADPYETERFIYKMLALILAGELLLRYTFSRRRLKILIHVVIAVAFLSALFGIARQALQQGEPGFLLPNLPPDMGYGQFINRSHFAFLMEMALGLVAGLLVGGGVRRELTLSYVAAAAPMWLALVLANSRGGIFSMLCQALFIVWLFSTMRVQPSAIRYRGRHGEPHSRSAGSFILRSLVGLGLVAFVAVGVAWVGGDPLVSRLNSETTEAGSVTTTNREHAYRQDIWRATWRLIKANPATGVGMGGYWAAIAQYHDASGSLIPQQAHNDYLELLASGGPVAVAFGAWFVFILIRSIRKRLVPDPFLRASCFGALAGLFAVAVHSFVDFGLHITVNALVFMALVVIATVNVRAEKPSLARD